MSLQDRYQAFEKLMERISQIASGLVAQGAAILTILSLAPEMQLPPALSGLIGGIGVNIMSNILERTAHGDEISNDELLKQLELATVDLKRVLSQDQFYSSYAHLLSKFQDSHTEHRIIIQKIENLVKAIDLHQEYIGNLVKLKETPALPKSLYQLPPTPADFVGRNSEITKILADIESQKGIVISELTGLGGIGKTALGLYIAHKIANQYPDGQIFLDLKGTTTPLSALEVMRYVALSFEPNINVSEMDEKSAFAVFNSLLGNKKVLFFLDNARSAEQIIPLPNTCGLLVTSRWTFHIPKLQTYHIEVFTEDDAKKFLLTLCPRVGEKSVSLAKACAYLPLALLIAGSFLQENKDWAVDKYIAILEDPKKRLPLLETSREQIDLGREPSLITTFNLSYQVLGKVEQNFWQMMGVLQHSFNWQEIANLWELDEGATLKLLSLFRRYNLITFEENSYLYTLHDFLADYGLQLIRNSISTAKKASNFRDELKWTILLAFSEKNSSNFNGAIDLYKRAMVVAQTIGERHVEAFILNGLGILYREIGEHRLSIECNENALVIGEELNSDKIKLSAFSGLGNGHESIGNSNLAIEHKEKALGIAQKIKDRYFEAKILNNLGNSYEDFDPLKAIETFEKALVIARDIKDRLNEGNILTNAGIAYYAIGNYDKAVGNHNLAREIFQELNDLDGIGATLSNEGNCYLELGQIDKAIDCYTKFLSIARQTYYRNGEANALGNLGRAYSALGELDKAEGYFADQLGIARQISDRIGEGNSWNETGVLYIARKQIDTAVGYIRQSLTIFTEVNDKSGEGYALWNLGKAYCAMGDTEQARMFGEQALEIFQSISSLYIPKVQQWLKELNCRS